MPLAGSFLSRVTNHFAGLNPMFTSSFASVRHRSAVSKTAMMHRLLSRKSLARAGSIVAVTVVGMLFHASLAPAGVVADFVESGGGVFNTYTIPTFPANFGTTSTTGNAASLSTSSATMFVQVGNPQLWIENIYALGTPVTGSLTWNDKTFATMGLAAGSYVYDWGGDSITLNVVPEPADRLERARAGP